MGNSVEPHYQTNPNQYASSQVNPNRSKISVKANCNIFRPSITPHKTQPIRLSALRHSLSASECFYVLNALIQQYFSLFRLYRKVVVSDQLCLVNQFGEVKVDFCIDGPETHLLEYDQVTHCFVTVLSQLVALVQRLGRDQELQERESLRFKRELISRVQSYHGNEEATYHSVMQLLTSFLQENNVRCNLLDAFLRYWSEGDSDAPCSVIQQEQTPFLANSRVNRPQTLMRHSQTTCNLHQDYYGDYSDYAAPKPSYDTATRQSHIQDRRGSAKGYSRYRHKMVKTEGEGYYESMGKRNGYQPSNYYEETSHTRFEKHACNRISHQYTLNILHAATEETPFSNQKKGLKYNKSALSLKPNESGHSSNMHRRETSLHDYTAGKIEHSCISVGKSYAKSMLEQLARSVSIKDQPNSRDQIN